MEILGLTKSLPRLRPACLPIQIVRLFIPIHIPDSNVALTSIDPIQWDSLLFVVHRLSSHCGRKREMKTHSPNGFVISIPSTHDTDSVSRSLAGCSFTILHACAACERWWCLWLSCMSFIQASPNSSSSSNWGENIIIMKWEMNYEERAWRARRRSREELYQWPVDGWWGCCCCYSSCCCSCGWVFARKRELIILTRILGRPRGFM